MHGIVVQTHSYLHTCISFISIGIVILLSGHGSQWRWLLAIDVLNTRRDSVAEGCEGLSIYVWPWVVWLSILADLFLPLWSLGAHSIFQSLLVSLLCLSLFASVRIPLMLWPHSEYLFRRSCFQPWSTEGFAHSWRLDSQRGRKVQFSLIIWIFHFWILMFSNMIYFKFYDYMLI